MMKEVMVTKVGYSSIQNCVTIEYEKKPGVIKKAAVAEQLSLKVGDKVWVLKNDKLDYKGFNAVAVLLA